MSQTRGIVLTIDIIAGSSAPGLAHGIASLLGINAHYPFIERFPDGETHVILGEESRFDTAIYVQTMHPDPNDMLMETLIMADMLKAIGTKRIIAVMPYLGYTRQDARHKEGEAIAIRTILKLLETSGVDDILSVDIHLHRLGLPSLNAMSRVRIHEVSAVDLLAKEAGRGLRSPLVVGPDSESERWAKRASELLGGGYDVLEKHRLSPTKIEIRPKNVDVKGRDVIIIDDIVSTGGTIKEVIRSLKAQGASTVTAAFTHAVLSDRDSVTGLYRAGASRLISTNTINNEFSIVDVATLLSDGLKEITR